jgi:hypothetical protein
MTVKKFSKKFSIRVTEVTYASILRPQTCKN